MNARPPVTCSYELKDALTLLEGRFAERSVEIDGGVVSYRSCGSGPVVVLLHGISSGAASWLHCALKLEKDAQVIAWNAPGYGRSTPLPMSHPKAVDYAARLEQFVRALGIVDCVLVGHSLGALMASGYIGAGFDRARRVVLMSPAQGYGAPEKQARAQQVLQERMEALHTLGVDGMAQKRSGRLLSEHALETQRAWVRWNMQWLDPAGYTQAVHLLCGDDIDAGLDVRKAGLPMAVYCGALDVVTTPEASRALAQRQHLPFHLLEEAGHACYIEQPGKVAGAIREHLYQIN
ncbi:alpha/beta hydrolase [Herbaspirillum lusitanum]|uniref:Alpha/beta hydrolase n=1 Tax=Herbaspirillum lusitanum TaxID=213312 RepID=A0ABW9AFD5_9BURK